MLTVSSGSPRASRTFTYSKRGRFLLVLLTLPALLLSGLLGTSTKASADTVSVSCYGDYCSGQDPVASGCSKDAITVAAHEQDNGGGIVEVRWSPTCKTNWAKWTQYPTGWCLNCGIVALAAVQDTGYTQEIDLTSVTPADGDSVWTPMIYSPVHRVKAEAMNICGGESLVESAFDCATNGWESTKSV
jgi:hypothetical protein